MLCFIKAPFKPINELGEYVLESLLQRRVKRQVSDEIEFFHAYIPENEVELEVGFDDGFLVNLKASHRNQQVFYRLLLPNSEENVATFRMTTKDYPQVWTPMRSDKIHEPLGYLFSYYKQASSGQIPDSLVKYVGDN